MSISYVVVFDQSTGTTGSSTINNLSFNGSSVIYDVSNGAGGTVLQDQVGTLLANGTMIQPSGLPPPPTIDVSADATTAANGIAVNVRLANASDFYVNETGDTMSGPLDMGQNPIQNAQIDSGTF